MEYAQALELVVASVLNCTEIEYVALSDAHGRYLAQDLHAPIAVPGFDNSAMDGYAVKSNEIDKQKAFRVSQRITAGDAATTLESNTIARIFTGAMMPENADAVILQEDSTKNLNGTVSFSDLPQKGQHIRRSGNDITLNQSIAVAGTRLSAAQLGLIASLGINNVPCRKRLRVAFFSTGDELKEPGQKLELGQIYNSNRYLLAACIEELGMEPVDLGRCIDSPDATREMLLEAGRQADCVVTTGGMSVGEEDYVRSQVELLGEVRFWKIAMKPGKPFAMGSVQGTPFFGLPGNPVSSFVTFQLLVRPWLLKHMGSAWQHCVVQASAQFTFKNKGVRVDFLRGSMKVGKDGLLSVELFDNQSSGAMSSIADSNVLIPASPKSEIKIGDIVDVILLVADSIKTT